MKHLWIVLLVLVLVACGDSDDGGDGDDNEPSESVALPAEIRPTRPEDLPTAEVEDVLPNGQLELDDGQVVQLIGLSLPPEDHFLYDDAMSFLNDRVAGAQVGIEVGSPSDETNLAYIWTGEDLVNYELVRSGMANRLLMVPDVLYDVFIANAEEVAVAEAVGIWEPTDIPLEISFVQATPTGDSPADDEFVRITNTGDEDIELTGFTLSDADQNTYTFGEFTLGAGQLVAVHSGRGIERANRLFWGLTTEVWDNASDIVFLRDDEGRYIDHFFIGQ